MSFRIICAFLGFLLLSMVISLITMTELRDEDIDFMPSYELTGDEIISKFAQMIKDIQNEEEKSKVKEYVIKKISEM